MSIRRTDWARGGNLLLLTAAALLGLLRLQLRNGVASGGCRRGNRGCRRPSRDFARTRWSVVLIVRYFAEIGHLGVRVVSLL